jgi:hypothetical protein
MKAGRVRRGASGIAGGALTNASTTGSAAMQSVHPHPTCTAGGEGDFSATLASVVADVEPLSSPMHVVDPHRSSVSKVSSIGSKDEHPMHQIVSTASTPRIIRARESMASM